MINNQQIEQKKQTLAKQIEQYANLSLHKSYRGIAALLTAAFSLLVVWNNAFLFIFLVPLIWFIAKGKRWAMIVTIIYSIFLALVLIANYIEMSRNAAGDFVASLTPVYFYLILCGVIIRYLFLALKVEKLRKLQKIS